eukprot:superscaffoldBa00000767_g7106
MSRETFPFSSTSLRSLRLEQEFQDWEDARRAVAHRRAMSRAPLPRAPRPPPRQQRLQEVRAPPPQIRCRDVAVHNTFMCGDMKGVYAVLKDPGMVNALMETVHEEMVWAPEMGMWTLSSKVKQTSALRLAASRGHTGCVEELLFRGAEVNDDPGGNTALHDACIGGHDVCVQVLLSHGADPEVLAADGSAPLHLCTSGQSFQCAKLLLEGGAEVNVRNKESRLTPLHVAARRGLEEHVELFLSHGADVLATNQEGETPLNAACGGAERLSEAGRYLRVIQKLLDAGANPRTAGRKQHTPLHNACSNCCHRIVDVLLQHGAKADMLKQCVLSISTLEVMLNSYTSVPPCEWMDSLSDEIYEDHPCFFDLVRQRSGQPRSLQHLCRCALRQHLGAGCYSAVSKLDIPGSVKDYLLLCNDGTLQ